MQGSKLGLQIWGIAIYILTTGLKGTSSMTLHRDLNITQKTAWYLAHRIRETWEDKQPLSGPVAVNETYQGGEEADKQASQEKREQRNPLPKQAIVGRQSRETKAVTA